MTMSDSDYGKIISKNLKRIMYEHEKTQADISKDLKISKATVSSWVTGSRVPRMDKIDMLCSYFNVSRYDIMEDHRAECGCTPNPPMSFGHYRIPVLTTVAAGKPIYAEEDVLEWIDYDKEPGAHVQACRIEGNSMIPRIQNGDTVIFDSELGWEDGDVVIATVNGDHATCKRIKRYADGIALLSDNANYAPMYFSAEEVRTLPVKIIGRVTEVRGKL